jgi:hypothetical protein
VKKSAGGTCNHIILSEVTHLNIHILSYIISQLIHSSMWRRIGRAELRTSEGGKRANLGLIERIIAAPLSPQLPMGPSHHVYLYSMPVVLHGLFHWTPAPYPSAIIRVNTSHSRTPLALWASRPVCLFAFHRDRPDGDQVSGNISPEYFKRACRDGTVECDRRVLPTAAGPRQPVPRGPKHSEGA